MSFEECLDRHSEALNNLAAAIREGASIATTLNAGGKPATFRASAQANKPEAAAVAATATPKAAMQAATLQESAAGAAAGAAAAAPAAGRAIRYEEIKEGFLKVGEVKGNAVAIGLLGEFKTEAGTVIKSGKELLAADYHRFSARVKELLPPAIWSTLSLSK